MPTTVQIQLEAAQWLQIIAFAQSEYVKIRQNQGLSEADAWAECDTQSSAIHGFIAAEKTRLAGSTITPPAVT